MVQTQIILAVVGSLIMLVVGASLARAFGIVGAANLIRYRSKIDDPKDAVVMLCALSVGLASGVGLYGLAVIGTVFIAACLWVIEGFEPQTRIFELSIKFGDKTQELRPKIEEVLRRFKVKYELRTAAEDAVSYMATAPRALRTDRVSNTLMELEPSGKGAIEWEEKSRTRCRSSRETHHSTRSRRRPDHQGDQDRQEVDRRLHLPFRSRRCGEGAGGGGPARRRPCAR